MVTRTASCACGQIAAVCNGAPETVAKCHCRDCQRRTGSPYGVAAFFLQDRVEVTGEARAFERPADSGGSVVFNFCPNCGSTVLWWPSRKPGVVGVAVGAFADPDFPAPTKTVFAEHRHRWTENE